jgi:hypothetical protein
LSEVEDSWIDDPKKIVKQKDQLMRQRLRNKFSFVLGVPSMKLFVLPALLSTFMLSSVAIAQVPIGSLQRRQGVTISGQVRCVVGNEFILDDGTGQIIVDAGPRWFQRIDLVSGERVTVTGEFDDEDDGEFDAFTITRSNGQVIQVR